MARMTINLWKLSTFVCGGLLISTLAWKNIPTASADQSDAPVAYDQACDDQDHMRSALDHLREGRHELHLAAHNKGDHRRDALVRTQEAINQVKAGCRFADDARDSE